MAGRAKRTADPADGFGRPQVVVEAPPDVNQTAAISVPSGDQGAVLVLGAGLAAVALWSDVISPLWQSAWKGKPLQVTMPAPGIISMILFIGALVFIADLSPDGAQLAFWFVLALWLVFLVMHPQAVATAAGWLSQGSAGSVQQQTPGQQDSSGGHIQVQ